MTKEVRAVKANRGIWNSSWLVVGLLTVILAAVLLAFNDLQEKISGTVSTTPGHFWSSETQS
jgi:hypothetical protein